MKQLNEADKLRESWCILVITAAQGTEYPYASGWGLGVGNASQLLTIDEEVISQADAESGLLESLGEKLDAQRYRDTALITPSHQTLAFLRARFLNITSVSGTTIRGYRHVPLGNVIEEYFDISAVDVPHLLLRDEALRTVPSEDEQRDPETAVEQLWQLRSKISSLVPAEALRGDPT